MARPKGSNKKPDTTYKPKPEVIKMEPETHIETIPKEIPAPAKEQEPVKMVKFTIANLQDMVADGKIIPEMSFHYGNPPKTYRVLFNGKLNEAPLEVVEHLKTRAYDQYKPFKDPDTGDAYMVKDGVMPRFMISIVG